MKEIIVESIICKILSTPFEEVPENVKKIIFNIFSNYSDFKLSVEYIVDKTDLGRSQTYENLKNYIKTPPGELITRIRMLAAIEQMCFSDYSIFNICNNCGYYNQRTFRNLISKFFLKSPTELKKEIKSSLNKSETFKNYTEIIFNFTE